MRVIPGEYPLKWIGLIASAAHRANENLGGGEADADALRNLGAHLTDCLELANATGAGAGSDTVRRAAAKARHLLERLRAGWNTMGLWSASNDELPPDQYFEQRMAQRELRYRMRYIQRECLWPVRALDPQDAAALAPLWQALGAS